MLMMTAEIYVVETSNFEITVGLFELFSSQVRFTDFVKAFLPYQQLSILFSCKLTFQELSVSQLYSLH